MSKIRMYNKGSWLALSVAICSTAAPTLAQEQPADGASGAAGEIVVTARKRSEDILKTPVAVSVVTGEAIARQGIVTVADLGAVTPGMNVTSNAAGRNDRSFQSIIIRGFAPVNAVQTTVSTFIDGAPVASPSAFNSISDPARIEILKGPQSAYFGRNTFAGAVNVVTKAPTGEWGGSVQGMVGTRSNYRIHGDIEAPIAHDRLTLRLAGDRFAKDGSYRNGFTDQNITLGDQSTTTVSGQILAKPTDDLTIKAFGMFSRDKDGPPAQGFISAYGLRDARGNVVVADQSNCTIAGRTSGTPGAGSTQNIRGICGTTPTLITSPSVNAVANDATRRFLATARGRLISPEDGVRNYGLLRRYYHAHLNIDYAIADTGLTLSSITGYNHEETSQMSDIDNWGSTSVANTPALVAQGALPYYDQVFITERRNKDVSQEVRLGFDNGGLLRATIGGSYLKNSILSDIGGGNGALGITSFVSTAGKTQSRTKGGFFALSYRFFDAVTVNAEGRYQVDSLYAYASPLGLNVTTSTFLPAGFYQPGSLLVKKTYKNFLPRVIAQWDIDLATMVYASWAKGVNPGLFNTLFLTSPPATVRAAAAAGIGIGVDPEKVTNYEIGLKGALFDRRLRYAFAAYYAKWRNQINSVSVFLVDPDTLTTQSVGGYQNTGNVNMKGVEGDLSAVVNDLITINASAAINDTDIRSYVNPTVSRYSGVFDFSGKELNNSSKYSASVGVQLGGDVAVAADDNWFVRGDYMYKSGIWSDAANITRTPDIHKVNFRGGVTIGNASIEFFVKNAFNTRAYTSIAPSQLLEPSNAVSGFTSAVVVGLQELRTIGTEVKYKF